MANQNTKSALSKAVRYIGSALAGAGVMAAVLFALRNPKPSTLETDVNDDGRTDVILMNEKGYSQGVFIQKEGGSYDKCKYSIRDGIPFYPTEDGKGYYDSWGSFFEFDSNNPLGARKVEGR